MLKKLSNAEKANLYRAVADMENNYGLQRVEAAMKELCETLDGKKRKITHEQIELLPFETGPDPEPERPAGRRKFKGRRPRGENSRLVKKYFEIMKNDFKGADTPEEMIIQLYYYHNENQYKIAERIGVDQRAISDIIRSVSEQKKRALISRWEEGKVNGY